MNVSILVLLDVSLKVRWFIGGKWRWNVSILVLLDVSLKASTWKGSPPPSKCFNPCSFGCQSESLWGVGEVLTPGVFQSLFFWLSVWKREPDANWIRIETRLVLLDVSLKERRCQAGLLEASEFQSLFFWMSVWKPLYSQAVFIFSPVSILVLLDVSLKDDRDSYKYYKRTQNVSILVLLDVSLKARKNLIRRGSGGMFQSLFFWMSVWKPADAAHADWVIEVSILVLLDVSLKVKAAREPDYSHKCFNPCSFGCQSESFDIL